MTNVNSYDEYGIPATGGTAGALSGRFGYTGQVWLPELGMYYYRARIYSPTLGRFLQTDPIGYADGMNLYAYVGNDPINASDPSGLSKDECPGAVKTKGRNQRKSCAPPGPGPSPGPGSRLYKQTWKDESGVWSELKWGQDQMDFDLADLFRPASAAGGFGEGGESGQDRCAARTTPLLRGAPPSAVYLDRILPVAQQKYLQHSWPLGPDLRPQSTFGGAITALRVWLQRSRFW